MKHSHRLGELAKQLNQKGLAVSARGASASFGAARRCGCCAAVVQHHAKGLEPVCKGLGLRVGDEPRGGKRLQRGSAMGV